MLKTRYEDTSCYKVIQIIKQPFSIRLEGAVIFFEKTLVTYDMGSA
ncbi:hypothetical protein [Heyndrickxia oleronia]|nr:hypothetical protein [Heyndrickxia oleronia]